jgi:hypothetical protein
MSSWRARWQQRRAHWEREKLRLYYHEASHCAAHVATGCATVERVGVIGTGPEMFGYCDWRAGKLLNYWAMTVCALSGPISDEIFFSMEADRSTKDWKHAREYAAKVDASNVDVIVEQAHRYAGDLIHRNARVEQLALRLVSTVK